VHKGTERSWCYIDDAVNAIELLIKRKQRENYEIFNIGREDPISTELLAEKIVKICDSYSEIRRIEVEPTVIPIKRASFKRARELLGWEAIVPLDEGLKKVAEWARIWINGKLENEFNIISSSIKTNSL
jgi:dTDP-glucose 4,6-dehydratase